MKSIPVLLLAFNLCCCSNLSHKIKEGKEPEIQNDKKEDKKSFMCDFIIPTIFIWPYFWKLDKERPKKEDWIIPAIVMSLKLIVYSNKVKEACYKSETKEKEGNKNKDKKKNQNP